MQISAPQSKIEAFSKHHHVQKLSFFGSVLRDDFRADSDIDVLVEFESGKAPGFIGLAQMERELSVILGYRKVDLRTPEELSRYFRQEVLNIAQIQYDATI